MIPEAILIQTAKPFIDSLIEKCITPKISKFADKCKLKYNELLIPRNEHFEEYLYRTYKKYSILNTLVFKNEQKLLTDLYIPLTITKAVHQSGTIEHYKIDKYPADLVSKCNKILITDTAGMGKSTLTKRLFLDVVENGYGIPIYIEMRRLTDRKTILQEIQEQIDSLSKAFDKDLLLAFIQTGGFIFFFDGYDEISIDNKSIVTANVQDFISKASNNVFILTSRPEQALAGFGDFQKFTINPLLKKEAYELIRKYDNQGTTSKELIDKLKTGQFDLINEFLKNPLLVSLLYAAYDYKQTIPLKKNIFYRQVYDAYFDRHDLSKGDGYIHNKKSNLDIDNFDRVLRFIGYKCMQKQKIEFEKDALLKIIEEAKAFCSDLFFGASDFFDDILSAVPLFCQDGQYYKWVHKSLQEYFAAQFIFKDTKKKQDEILNKIYNSNNADGYINILDIYYDIDSLGFIKNIELPLLKDFTTFFDENLFTSDIITNDLVEDRIGLIYSQRICIDKININDLNPRVIFDEMRPKFKEKFNLVVNSMTINYSDYIIGCYATPNLRITNILFQRKKELFRHPSVMMIKDSIDLEPTEINSHTGEEDAKTYSYINSLLSSSSYGDNIFDYEQCLKEIEHISEIVKRNEESLELLEGL